MNIFMNKWSDVLFYSLTLRHNNDKNYSYVHIRICIGVHRYRCNKVLF